MEKADNFINQVHDVMLKGDFVTLTNKMIDKTLINDTNFDENLAQVYRILGDAQLVKVEKKLGYSININNGVTEVESNYLWLGNKYNVSEKIIVSNSSGAFKVLGLHVEKQ